MAAEGRKCGDCSEVAPGRVDPEDGVFYCDACWAANDADIAAAEVGPTRPIASLVPGAVDELAN